MRPFSPYVIPLALLLLASCAHRPAAPSTARQVMEFDPVTITPGSPEEQQLATLTDEELFALGTSSFAAEEFEKAARCFSRLADGHPDSPHRAQALFNAGLAYERLGRFTEALERFAPLMDPAKGTGDALLAAFRVAECYYHLERYGEAVDLLTTIANRTDIAPQDKLQAAVQRGICLIEEGKLPDAEAALRDAIGWWEGQKENERLDTYFPAQAQFFLGEIYRMHFENVPLDPLKGEEKLARDLEEKCQLLLSAQGHYLRAIRMGEGQWATASGFRIGALYETLHEAMVKTKAPPGLDEEQVRVYHEELRKKVRVLVTKAMGIYERTLAAAERLGVENPFVAQTRRSLERMKQLLLEEGGPAAAAPAVPEGAQPAQGVQPEAEPSAQARPTT